MFPRSLTAALAAACLLLAHPSRAQSSSNAPARQPYTFQAGTHVVLTDVTVTDHNGNPVRGLKASDFQIYDNGKPQAIATFEEHVTTPVASLPRISTAPGVYSNAFLEHLPPVLNIIVLDITNLEIPDQMYLNERLTRLFQHLPPGQPVAIYWRDGPASLLLQTFTSNHALLLAALHKAMPRFPPPDRIYYSDFTTLLQIALDFDQYPGRKNILWFSGGSTLYLKPDPNDLPTMVDWRTVYDELETSRIAIYPIDARGLTLREPYSLWLQHALMNDIARTTGGHAYYNTNGFAQTTAHWLKTSGSFYTITYSPRNFRLDNKWHKVEVKLDVNAHYNLSYRRGYFADSASTSGSRRPNKHRALLLANGEAVTALDMRSAPIIFQAHVLPASAEPAQSSATQPSVSQLPPKKGTIPYTIHYLLPVAAFTPRTVAPKHQIEFGVAAFSFDKNGEPIARLGNRVTLGFNPAKLRAAKNAYFAFDQRINLRKGQNYLYLAVWDMTSGRLGTLHIPFEAAKHQKSR